MQHIKVQDISDRKNMPYLKDLMLLFKFIIACNSISID